MRRASWRGKVESWLSRPSEDRPVSSTSVAAPRTLPATPLGIVIKNGGPSPKPVRFWAYLWAADEETSADHWHQRVPTEHAA